MDGQPSRKPLPGPPSGRDLRDIPWGGEGHDPLEELWELS